MNPMPKFETWWQHWVNLDTGIPYWNPYGAGFALLIALIAAFNILKALRRAQTRRQPSFLKSQRKRIKSAPR